MRGLPLLLLVVTGCRVPGPLAGGASEIREGTFSRSVSRILSDVGAAFPDTSLLPASARDSAAVYLFATDERGIGVRNAEVVLVPVSGVVPKTPAQAWQSVDSHGVYVRRYAPGEYILHVRSPFHWQAKRVLRLRAGTIDTLLAVMRNGTEASQTMFKFP